MNLLEKAKSKRQIGRLPLGQYWLIRQHGSEIVDRIMKDNWAIRTIATHLKVSPQTVEKAVTFMSENEETFAVEWSKIDWRTVEDKIFASCPNFRSQPFYKRQVEAGYEAYRASLEGKNLGGRKRGTKVKVPVAKIPSGTNGGVGEGSPNVAVQPPAVVPTTPAPAQRTITPIPPAASSTNFVPPVTRHIPAPSASQLTFGKNLPPPPPATSKS